MAPPKFPKDSRSKGPSGSKPRRPRGDFKGASKGGAPRGDGPKGPRSEFKGGGAKGDFKGGPKGPRSEYRADHKGGGTRGDFKGGPKGPRSEYRADHKGGGPRGELKGGPKGPRSEFKGDHKGGRARDDFKGGSKRPRGEFKPDHKGGASRGDFKGGPRSEFKKGDAKGSSKGYTNAKPFRAPPRTYDAPRVAPEARTPRPVRSARPTDPGNWLYGIHAVQAALANPRRKLGRLLLSARAAEIIGEEWPDHVRPQIMEPDAIGKLLPLGAVHQGAALETKPLPAIDLEALLSERGASESKGGRRRIVLVLDQLTDPHNVGAILRSAVAFGVTAVVVQDRHAPPQGGVLAKAASGALDLVPYVEVVNITRALEKLGEHGFWRIALGRPREGEAPNNKSGDGAKDLQAAIPDGDVALVLGSEGDGIRRLVREHCDTAALIPIDGRMESLNVSNAAAIALYELRRS